MKKLLTTIALSVITVAAFGQGEVNLTTSAGANTKFITEAGGTRIAGDGYWAQLYYANGAVADESQLIVAPGNPIHPRTGTAAGVLPSDVRRLNITPAGGVATLQIRAWSAVLGDNWDAALAGWTQQADLTRQIGKSALFQVDTSNPFATPTPETPIAIGTAFPGLTLIVPEPSTYVLGAVGLGLLALLRRRK
jgi:hypothetical protein